MQLHHGDCLEILPTLPDKSIDAVIADIPSGRTACAWDSVIPFDAMWKNLKRVAKRHAAIVLLGCTQPFTSALVMSNPKWLKEELIWEKDQPSNFAACKSRHLRYHESIVLFRQGTGIYNPQMTNAGKQSNRPGKAAYNLTGSVYGSMGVTHAVLRDDTLRYPRSVIRYNRVKHNSNDGCLHPTQKPLALLEYLVLTYTNEGDTVLDFTMGSGTTGHACVNLNRNFIGIEKDDHYFNVASERINTALSTPRQQSILD